MDHNNPPPGAGLTYAAVAIVMKVFAWISATAINDVMSLIATTVSIAAGLMAIRHYYLTNSKPKGQ